MPIITANILSGRPDNQKRELIRSPTDAAVHASMCSRGQVHHHQRGSAGHWGVGGWPRRIRRAAHERQYVQARDHHHGGQRVGWLSARTVSFRCIDWSWDRASERSRAAAGGLGPHGRLKIEAGIAAHPESCSMQGGIDAKSATFAPLFERPANLICIGANYRDHVAEMPVPMTPTYPADS